MSAHELQQRIDTLEESYELMLGYAAQGLQSDVGTGSGAQLRQFLERSAAALSGLAEVARAWVPDGGADAKRAYEDFVAVLERDAASTRAAILMVLAQPSISSQLIDNLNASIHLRALLTDLFLIDELLKPETAAAGSGS